MPDYQFFFSYAPENYENASWKLKEKSGNYLSDFFEAVCKGVNGRTGIPVNQVGYFDRVRLSVSGSWEEQLDGLQNSRVLVAILSPHYLRSGYCGREFQLFIEKFKLLKTDTSQQQPNRIVPVFWIDLHSCFKEQNQNIFKPITDLQWHQEGRPKNYPSVGIAQMYRLEETEMLDKVINCIVHRIVELASLPLLPALPDQFDFANLPSAWHE